MRVATEGCERSRLARLFQPCSRSIAHAMTAKTGQLRQSLEHITYMLDEALFSVVNALAIPPVLPLEVVESSVSAMVFGDLSSNFPLP